MPPTQNRTVWSSEEGDLRSKERKAVVTISLPPQQQTIFLHRDSKHRNGKGVTLLSGLVLNEADLINLAKILKQACGSGGTVKDGVIEIQGEHREKIADILRKLGYRTKIAGG